MYEQLLNRAVAGLSPRQQQTFLLIRKEGLKRDEAAKILQLSPETVKYHLEESVRRIRAFFLANGHQLKAFYPALIYVVKKYM